jgi:dienelactone hydrolase
MRLSLKSPLVAALACLVSWSAAAQGPQREEIVRIPAAGGATMVATVVRPPGEGRRPLAVINHGSPADSSQRLKMERPHYPSLSSWFVSRGYVVVLPERRGYGETGGAWAEDYGSCRSPDYFGAGLQGAADIKATIDHMRGQAYVTPDRTIVIGQSAGGGRGGHQKLSDGGMGNCEPDALVKAAGRYGSTARVPMLWLYTENDSFFEPKLARRMVDAYDAAGGRATLKALGPFGSDGHNMAGSSSGVPLWSGPVAYFLASLK